MELESDEQKDETCTFSREVELSTLRIPRAEEPQACSLCGGPTFLDVLEITSVYVRERSFSLFRCSQCELITTYPKPRIEELQRIYATEYGYSYHNLTANERRLRAVKLIKSLRLSRFEQCTEIGFGEGQFLLAMRNFGAQVGGCELSAASVARAISILGPESNLQVGDADNFVRNSAGISGLVVLNHVLEHLPNAEASLKLLAEKMDTYGRLLIVVPNTDSAPKGYLRRFWGYWQVPVHLNHFNPTSLNFILDKAGFVVEKTKFKGLDFLSLGLFFLNLRGTRGSSVATPGTATRLLVRGLSSLWPMFYHLGRADLVVLAARKP